MSDETRSHQDRLLQSNHRSRDIKTEPEPDLLEASCAAFGYLRGLHERADALELRFREGHSTWFPYGWLGNWEFNPSAGLLLKFSGDLVYLVLIRGSNLDQPLTDSTINLTSAGLQRHRVVWIREMTPDEIRQVGESGPTIDRIEVMEFQSHESLKNWLQATAPHFLINP
ncbi:MAG: hypothetical protein NT172_21085 [Planctomycetota bacterium]|nr:hypothetical protein [Planctomycetota bacterium]